MRIIAEAVCYAGEVPLWKHPEWEARFPWLVQGITGGEGGVERSDLGLFGGSPAGVVMGRWAALRDATSMPTAVHARQVHGSDVQRWDQAPPAGVFITESVDAHVTAVTGILLTVSVADCVPILLVAKQSRVVAVAHAGWRGAAKGVLERTLDALVSAGASLPEIRAHFGPAICGACYEVGPEVHRALDPTRDAPPGPHPIDLRLALFHRAVAAGVHRERITGSAHCTRCGPGTFFSHRAGSPGRQIGVIGVRG